jgi:hypothetical protein
VVAYVTRELLRDSHFAATLGHQIAKTIRRLRGQVD